MQRIVFAIGGLATLTASFFGTLYILDPFSFSSPFQSLDSIRIEHAKTLKTAIERYRAARGAYPSPYPNIELNDLKAELVGGEFIAQLPVDPYLKNGRVNKYRYRSLDGKYYGLLLYMELGPCQTGVGKAAADPWDGRSINTCAF